MLQPTASLPQDHLDASSCVDNPSSGASSSCNSSLSTTHTICYACNKVIYERFLLKAMDEYWHEDCLKCSCCDCRLGEVGSTLFTKANLILCKRDYLRSVCLAARLRQLMKRRA